MAIILGVAIPISFLLLLLSVHPGLCSELAALAWIGSPFWLPAACISFLTYFDIIHQVPDRLAPHPARRWLVVAALVLAFNGGLLWGGVARRLAFQQALPAFEALVAAPPAVLAGNAPADRRLGVYDVDRIAADPRGGLYFRTRSRPGSFSLGRTAYGFAHRPNQAGSPFGDTNYALSHVAGDWYCFQASDP